jgi:osmotically-inducible protein OsmY
MNEQNRWNDDRYSDRYPQEDYRSDNYRTRDSYGRDISQDRYRDRSYGADRGGYGESGFGGGQRYGVGSRSYEERAFAGSDRGYDPYGAAYGGAGEVVNRDQRYGADPRDQRQYGARQASGAMLHQGYRAPFAGLRGDGQGYSSSDYGRGAYGDTTRYQYNDYQVDRNRQGAGYGARDIEAHDDRDFWSRTRDEVSSWFGDDEAARRRQMDDARNSVHRGRGPKGYTRSDDRIREDVNDRLTDDHMLDASDIETKVSNGEVTLTGHVESRQAKRRAEDIADRIAGVKHVQNNLRVHDHQTTSSFAASNGASAGSGQTGSAQTSATQTSAGQTSANQSATKSN